jgi:hypothetical protein
MFTISNTSFSRLGGKALAPGPVWVASANQRLVWNSSTVLERWVRLAA